MKNSAKLLKKLSVITFAALTLGLAACQKKEDSSGVQGMGIAPMWQSCGGCAGTMGQAIPGLVGVRSSTVDETVLFAFDLLVSQNGMIDWNNPKAILFYNGPASIQGALRVTMPGMSLCGAPAGDYQIRPLSPSTIASGGMISYGTFEAVGPGRIIFRLGSSSLYNAVDPYGVNRNSATNRINLNLMIDSVNGMACGPLVTR